MAMRYFFSILLFLMTTSVFGQTKERYRIVDAADIVADLKALPEQGIPPSLMEQAEAVVIIPKLKKAGFVVGGKHGKGIALVKDATGRWSDPSFVKMTGGSIGFQIGYSSTDIFLIFRKAKTLQNLARAKGKFTLGGDVSVAAGPAGRQASASTDLDFKAEVYSYSRSRGLFAGISLDGSELRLDSKANAAYYGDEREGERIMEKGYASQEPAQEVDRLKKVLTGFSQ